MADEKRDILILDEESESLMNLFDVVYGQGFETIGVSTEAEALSYVARKKPDVVIDRLHGSPGGSAEFITHARKVSPQTRIILLTDRGASRSARPEADDSEEFDGIPDPLPDSELLRALDRVVESQP